MPQDDPDLELVQRLQSGHDDALNDLMTRHQERVHRFIWHYVQHEHDARELTQEVFVRVYFNINKFNPRSFFAAWLYTIATNLCRDHVRSRAYKLARQSFSLSAGVDEDEAADIELDSNEAAPSEILRRQEKMRAVQLAIDELPPALKEPFIATILEGASYKECALRLGLTEKAVEIKIYRARKILAEKIRDF
ncbi:MAG: sigma-70 family RNA polymerase sigma factor [Verrucomicrobiales bacterium]|jgi:RNA polymerase sigma-70 factor (ECF subfamily)|nr:sigma-70 family RNA polymerase sigma factor [Verrucomicrobiales bacterium]